MSAPGSIPTIPHSAPKPLYERAPSGETRERYPELTGVELIPPDLLPRRQPQSDAPDFEDLLQRVDELLEPIDS